MANSLWAPRIYSERGFVREDIVKGVRALDLGCGDRKLPGSVGIDRLALPSVDIVHDLSVFPWPIKDASYDLVFANHFMEHTPDFLRTMEEVHRILAPGGRLVFQVPYFRALDAFTDPTHTRYFTSATVEYFIADSKLAAYAYTDKLFTKKGFWYGWPHPSKNPVREAFKKFIHSHTTWYDQYLSLVIPTECLTWELEKIQ